MGKSVELRSKKGKSRQNSPEWIIMYLKDWELEMAGEQLKCWQEYKLMPIGKGVGTKTWIYVYI